MKRIKIIFLLIISYLAGISQNNATDFNALDCDGVSHHLFSELDSGKVIVVTGGAGHYIYFNKNGSTQNINSAIDLALTGAGVTTSINDKKEILNFHCYPNPSNGVFKINYSFKNKSNWTVELYNLIGEKILKEKMISESWNGEHSINTQDLPNGTYLVRLVDGYLQNSQILNISH